MAAVIAPQHAGFWQRRNQAYHVPDMNMTGIYDTSRTVTYPPVSRAYPTTTTHMDVQTPLFSPHPLTTSVSFQPGGFAFDPMSVNNPYNLQQSFQVSYPSGLPHAETYSGSARNQTTPLVRDVRSGFAMERTTPPIKAEATSPIQPPRPQVAIVSSLHLQQKAETGEGSPTTFTTDVDTLMRAIQAKQVDSKKCQPPTKEGEEDRRPSQKSKKKYACGVPNCGKDFYQKTHLEIHTRAHTGMKPFLCKEPTCGQRFSQLGNLKTHERRHTGEKPYLCDICGKAFAQRGNVRSHKIVHEQIKPFTCLLDQCGKQFTQLGNLKSHQNKFHANTIRFLTQKFATDTLVSDHDRQLWEYFASLYKNSNKGIKGRGKDRKISGPPSVTSTSSTYSNTTVTSLNRDYAGSIQQYGSDRSSRSSSTSSDEVQKLDDGYDFNTSIPFSSHSNSYSDSVFPERKMY